MSIDAQSWLSVPPAPELIFSTYDIFAGVNGKVYLTAPQRHHCGVMEGLMKAATLRLWWENPALPQGSMDAEPLCAPYSLLMHSDALWSLAGTEVSGELFVTTVF